MNQSRGHWLLLDALTIAITFNMEMEFQLLLELSTRPEIFDLIEAKICLLHRNMRLEVINVIKPFLGESTLQWSKIVVTKLHVFELLQANIETFFCK
jgi:hypothetical protein